MIPRAALCLVLCSTSIALAAPVDIKVFVKRKDRVEGGAQPFPDVGGFTIRRLKDTYSNAQCPDASNSKGELICRVDCSKGETLRVYVRSPNGSAWPGVRGYAQPPDVPVDISACKLAGPQSIAVIYKSAAVLLAELTSEYPELLPAVAEITPASSSGAMSVRFKPFEATAGALEKFSSSPSNRDGLVKLAEFSALSAATAEQNRQVQLQKTFAEYEIGSKSVFFKAFVTEALGERGGELVRVSAKRSDYLQSIQSVEKLLGQKASLTRAEVLLVQQVKDLKQGDPTAPYAPVRARRD